MVPTWRGAVLAFTGLVLYLLASQSQVGWYYVADALVWALLLVNLFFPWWSLRGLKAGRRLDAGGRPQGIFEGDTVTVSLNLENPGMLPRYFLRLLESCPLAPPEEPAREYLVGVVGPHSSTPITYQARCHQRGDYRFGPLQVECSAPFGLFRARRRLPAPLQLLVYPEVFHLAGAPGGNGPIEGPALARLARSPGEFRGAREYQPGDSLRFIHWRRSAGAGRLMVKEYDASPERQLTVLFDAGRSFGAGKEATLEYAIKVAASLAQACLLQGVPFRMVPPGPKVAFPHCQAVLAYLARLKTERALSLADVLTLRQVPGSTVAILSLANQEAPELLARIPAGKLAALVALQGFSPAMEERGLIDLARSMGVPVVTCAPGGAAAAVALLAAQSLSAPRIPAKERR